MKTAKLSKIILYALILLGSVLLFTSCNLFGFLNKKSNKDVKEGSFISTNPTDPQFVKLITDKDEEVSVFGERDASGLPSKIRQINIKDSKGENYSFFYNKDGKLTTAVADNGTVFNYKWLGNNKIALNIICNDGKNQIDTEIDLAEIQPKSIKNINTTAKIRSNAGVNSKIRFTPIESPVEKPLLIKSAKVYEDGTVHNLTVTSCGALSNYEVLKVNIVDQAGITVLKELNAVWVGKGKYTITVPSGLAPELDPQKTAEALAKVLSKYCDAAGLVGGMSEQILLTTSACAYISGKLALTGVGVTVAPTVGAACTGVTSAMAVYCATLGASGPPESPSILHKMLELKFLDYFKLTGGIRMHVYFKVFTEGVSSGTKIVGFNVADGVPSNLKAEMSENAKPMVKYLELSPSSPSEGQDYTITAGVYCLPVGSTVTISMAGSDGYSDSETYTINDVSQSSGNFSLAIPGADKGVRDEITVTVTTPEGFVITKSASLVFGN